MMTPTQADALTQRLQARLEAQLDELRTDLTRQLAAAVQAHTSPGAATATNNTQVSSAQTGSVFGSSITEGLGESLQQGLTNAGNRFIRTGDASLRDLAAPMLREAGEQLGTAAGDVLFGSAAGAEGMRLSTEQIGGQFMDLLQLGQRTR